MASNIVATQINGEDITKGFNPILAQYEVTGSAVTSIDFSGLDINAHGGSYEIEIRWYSPVASTSFLFCFINNDTTSTNYYSVVDQADGTSQVTARNNNAGVSYSDGIAYHMVKGIIGISNGYAFAITENANGVGSAIKSRDYRMSKIASVANITQLTFVTGVASNFGVGSKIIIRRKDK